MGLELEYSKGQSPLNEQEANGLLVKTISHHKELDEFEHLNIEKAVEWTIHTNIKREVILTEKFVKNLHDRMFGDVWKWAGTFRKSERNIGIKWPQIGVELKKLLDYTNYWIDYKTYNPEEISVRFKHRIVQIHCFPNGNGRHSRLMGDILMERIFNKEAFSWGCSRKLKPKTIRSIYISALKEADQGNIVPLLEFAKN
ncbi:MAG: mobile mystery protein B [Flavobacteriaceae bacterium]|nr:mobile mystery protein B [Flavobacteriaceae bacterium]